MRLRPRFVTIVVADLAGALTAAVIFTPSLHFAYRSPTLHATLETSAGIIALLGAYLAYGRYRQSGRVNDLALATGLGVLASSNFIFSAMPWALLSVESMRFSTWTTLVASVVGSALFAAASLLPNRRLRHQGRTGWLAIGLSFALVTCCAIAIGLLKSYLPLGIHPQQSPPPAGSPHFVGNWALTAPQLAAAVLFGIAAVGFTRRAERTSDELLTWLAASAALAMFARFDYSLFPSLYTQWVYIGDALRLGAYLLILGGTAREISRYQRREAEAAVLDERRRIARDLHDGLAQELAFIATRGRVVRRRADLLELSPELEYMTAAAERALDESRRAIAALSQSPDEPFDVTLIQTVEEIAQRVGSRTRLVVDPGVRVPPATREALLRIVREAVTNASRHGQANVVTVELSNGSAIRLRVADDGRGFSLDEAERRGRGFGLATMRERAEAVGAELRISSGPDAGTEIEVVLP